MRFKATQIRRGKAIVHRIRKDRWVLADLLLEIAPVSEFPTLQHKARRTKEGSLRGTYAPTDVKLYQRLSDFAKQIGCDLAPRTLAGMRRTAVCWPVENRLPACSFTAHSVLNGSPERFQILRPGMTEAEAAAEIGQMRVQHHDRTISWEHAVSIYKSSQSMKNSAINMFSRLSLTDVQLRYMDGLLNKDADLQDELISALGLEVEEAA